MVIGARSEPPGWEPCSVPHLRYFAVLIVPQSSGPNFGAKSHKGLSLLSSHGFCRPRQPRSGQKGEEASKRTAIHWGSNASETVRGVIPVANPR